MKCPHCGKETDEKIDWTPVTFIKHKGECQKLLGGEVIGGFRVWFDNKVQRAEKIPIYKVEPRVAK